MPPSAKKGDHKCLSLDDIENIADAVEKRLEDRFAKLDDAISKCVLSCNFEKTKSAVRVNCYEIDKLNQYTRRENLRIHGFQLVPGQKLSVNVVALFNHLARMDCKAKSVSNAATNITVDLEEGLDESLSVFCTDDISICHPVNPRAGSGKPQHIVRFVSRNKLMQVFAVKKYLSSSKRYQGIYITDDLTPLRMKLKEEIKKNKDVMNVYTRDGNIHCTYKGKHVIVTTPDDLFKLDMEADLEKLGLSKFV